MDLLRASSDEEIPVTVGFPAKHPGVSAKEHGWFLDTHKRVFARVLTPKTKVIVELGSWFGSSAKWFCANTDAIIYAIDIWDDSFILRDAHYVDKNSKVRHYWKCALCLSNLSLSFHLSISICLSIFIKFLMNYVLVNNIISCPHYFVTTPCTPPSLPTSGTPETAWFRCE
jgi:hypothetical protein